MSDEYIVEGIIESNSRDNKSIKVDGVWYRSFNPMECRYKDEVKFKVKEKPDGKGGVYRNVHGVPEILSGTPVGATGEAGSGGTQKRVQFPVNPTDRERSIIRRHAFSAAVEYAHTHLEDIQTFEEIVGIARQIENYTSGDELADLLTEGEE